MSLNTGKAKATGFKKIRPTEDTHPVLIAQIIDLGSQFNRDFQTQEIACWDDGNPKINDEIWVTFEFPTQTHTFDEAVGEQPLWVSRRYNLKSKALQELIAAAGFDPDKPTNVGNLGGRCVQAVVGSTSGGNAKILTVSRAKSKMLIDEEVVDTSKFTLSEGSCQVYDMDSPDRDLYNSLPDFLKELIDNQASKEVYLADKEEQEENDQQGEF